MNSVDPEKIKSTIEFVDYACTENRVNQFIRVLEDDLGRKLNKSDTGTLIYAVKSDIVKEELDTLKANNLEMSDYGTALAKEVRRIFFKQLDGF